MTAGWQDAAEVWMTVSSRIVSAHLQFKFGNLIINAREKLNVSVVSVYAPTHRAPAEIKKRFYDDLQAVIGSVPCLFRIFSHFKKVKDRLKTNLEFLLL